MKRSFQNVARWLNHKHVCAKLSIFFFIFLQSFFGYSQAGGFSVVSIQNLPSGYTECVINWNANTITTARGLNISVFVTGTSVCVDAAISSIDSYFTNPANGFTVSFSNTGITILKSPNGSNTFSLSTDYTPLLTILYRAEPGTTSTVNISGLVIQTGFSGVAIEPGLATQTSPAGFNLGGQIFKAQSGLPNWASCGGSSGVPGVTVAVAIPPGCFAGSSYPASQLFAQPPYQFFGATPGYAYTITPTKSYGLGSSTDVCCGVWTEDIEATRDLILGLNPGNLAQYLAADYNGNGFATANDMYFMWQCYNLITPVFPAGWSPWRFVPENVWALNDPPTGDMSLIPSSAVTGPLISNQVNHFRGVKRGDVNGNCALCGTSIINDISEGREEIESNHTFFISDHSLQSGQDLLIPIYTQSLSEAVMCGMQLDFDGEYLELLSLESQILSEDDMVLSNILSDNKISSAYFSWMSMKLKGEDLKEGAVIAYAHIRAKKDIVSLKGLISQPINPDYRIIRSNQGPFLVSLEIGDKNIKFPFDVKLVSQNPLKEHAQIDVIMPQADEAYLVLFDNSGQIFKQQRYLLSAGLNTIVLNEAPNA